jgi:hypothetical protein
LQQLEAAALGAMLAGVGVFGAPGAAAAAVAAPTAAMLAPVQGLVDFMSHLPAGAHPAAFAAAGLCIVENFAPFLFCNPRAATDWEAGFRAHAADEDLTELQAHFGAAHDYARAGDRVYFSLPTTWTGRTHGHAFVEHGAWAFVLTRHGSAWRIQGYGWGVTDYRES